MGLNILEHNNSTPLKTEGERYDHHQELAKELADQYDISEESSLEGVETYLNQINSLDSTDIQPDDIDPNSADVIRNTFDAYYDNPEYHDTFHRAQQESAFRPIRPSCSVAARHPFSRQVHRSRWLLLEKTSRQLYSV